MDHLILIHKDDGKFVLSDIAEDMRAGDFVLHVLDAFENLSRIIRFNGQAVYKGVGYSVLIHSIIAAIMGAKHGSHAQMELLLHDFGEAFIGDIIRPVKQDWVDPFEQTIISYVYPNRHTLDDVSHIVKQYDDSLLECETVFFFDLRLNQEHEIPIDISEGFKPLLRWLMKVEREKLVDLAYDLFTSLWDDLHNEPYTPHVKNN